jgi:dihydroorotate dehydrogenase
MYRFIRPLLFRLPPERAHNLTVSLLRLAGAFAPLRNLLAASFRAADLPVEAFGLRFRNPLGLAAGYDKDGLAWRGLAALGFGHLELGTVTPRPQPGNPSPRVFRLPEDQALINRMGFPGRGANFLEPRLQGYRPEGLVLGVNIGKNKDTPLEFAHEDYLNLLRTFAPLADYLAINVSSPNTAGLRDLQNRAQLHHLLMVLNAGRRELEDQLEKRVPLLVKLAPDLPTADLEAALEVILEHKMDGVIATNTTVNRESLKSGRADESGGLSGAPLREPSTRLVKQIHTLTRGKLPIIAVGGVMEPEDAREKLAAGATLVQLYTGLIYRGPGLVKKTLNYLNASLPALQTEEAKISPKYP